MRDSIRADVPDGAVPGGEPDIAFPVRSEAGDVVVGGNRTTEIDYIREFQPPTAVRILRMGNADQLTVSVDGYETVLVVEVGVDAAEQTALRERQLCYGSYPTVVASAFGSIKWMVGIWPIIVVQSETTMPSEPWRTVGQAAIIGKAVTSWGPVPGPGSGVTSDEPASPCMVEVPTGPRYGFAGASGPDTEGVAVAGPAHNMTAAATQPTI